MVVRQEVVVSEVAGFIEGEGGLVQRTSVCVAFTFLSSLWRVVLDVFDTPHCVGAMRMFVYE